MKIFIPALLMLSSLTAFAEDGLVIQFTINESEGKENEEKGRSAQSYTNAILMKLDETAKFEFKDLYNIKFDSRKDGNKVNLVVTLHDWMEGKPYYVGAQATDFEVGSKVELELKKYDRIYNINIDTSYGKPPE